MPEHQEEGVKGIHAGMLKDSTVTYIYRGTIQAFVNPV